MKAELDGIFAVKLPVKDLALSREWYEKVFELTQLFEFPDEDGVVRGVAYELAGLGDSGFALRERPDIAGLSGFDPVLFGIKDKEAADAWQDHLTDLGIKYELVLATIGWLVIFHDPDGLEIHLYSRAGHGEEMAGTPGRGRAVA
ncbi:VOC family protein [Streptomyces sp. SID13031]|uniref:VOC family protein n=1 Tax=Streptomyces sp. SID13031 TaxID=2706046 RepID=UPI0013C78185|nr:VOC family protein [Streptomyces sp. SID13031]NEA31364.1 VOC family protein [Streptomyces sp. SID13031]